MRTRRGQLAIPSFVAGIAITFAGSGTSVLTDSIATASSSISDHRDAPVTANSMKPAECAGLVLAQTIGPAGSPGTINSLVLANSGTTTLGGGAGDDCVVGSAATNQISGNDGNDVCLGIPTATFDPSCETVIHRS